MTLKALRESVAAALAGDPDLTVYSYVPEAVVAPAVVIQPGDPYVSGEGEPFGRWRVRFRLALVAEPATNEVATEGLDELIIDSMVALTDAGFTVEEVSEPYVFRANENMHLAADLTVAESIQP